MMKVKVLRIRKAMLITAVGAFLFLMVTFSADSLTAASKGALLFATVVLPALFPFFVISDMLYRAGLARAADRLLGGLMRPVFNVPGCGAFPLLIGLLCGYPVSASVTARLRTDMLITRAEAERLMAFTNNTGPGFIAGALAAGILRMPELAWPLIACNAVSCVAAGVVFRFHDRGSAPAKANASTPEKLPVKEANSHRESLGTMFTAAVRNSVPAILSVGGFVIFFTVFAEMLARINLTAAFEKNSLSEALFFGFFEITQGISRAGSAVAVLPLKMCAAGFMTGWAGLSVHAQVMSMIAGSDIRIKTYLTGKLLQGLISAALFAGLSLFI